MTDYAKLSEVRPGAILIADGGFECIKAGAELAVHEDRGGGLYVHCGGKDGRHYLDGQLDDHDAYVGLHLKATSGSSERK